MVSYPFIKQLPTEKSIGCILLLVWVNSHHRLCVWREAALNSPPWKRPVVTRKPLASSPLLYNMSMESIQPQIQSLPLTFSSDYQDSKLAQLSSMAEQHQTFHSKVALNQSLPPCSSSPPSSSTETAVDITKSLLPTEVRIHAAPMTSTVAAVKPNRCSTCNRRIGLTGFKCRCGGGAFCRSHRYPEQHACSFNFKAMGREQILKANPVIKASKLDKI